MKYLVYLLLVLNIAYFAWYQSQPPRTPPAPHVAPLPADVEPLMLLSERRQVTPPTSEPADKPADTAVEVTPEPELVPPVEIQPVCHTIGPVDVREEASGLLNQLTKQGHPAELRDSEVQAPSSYQVYLPEMSSEQAREIVKTLKAAGMTDYFVGKRNRISLGIFTNKGKARDRLQNVRKLGYDAVLKVRYKKRKVYWIDIEESDPALGESGEWQRILEHYPQMQMQQVSCE